MAPGFRDQGVWVMRSPDWIARESEGRRVERRAFADERSTCGGGRVVVSVVAGLAGLTFKGAAEARGPVRVSRASFTCTCWEFLEGRVCVFH